MDITYFWASERFSDGRPLKFLTDRADPTLECLATCDLSILPYLAAYLREEVHQIYLEQNAKLCQARQETLAVICSIVNGRL